jgi:alpha-beta hydrolase superfamily lysophospholipase
LARDAHTGNNPIAAENYLQHAEHYFRLIAATRAAQFQAQNGDVRAAGDSGPEDFDDDDDLSGLPDRFGSPGQQERQAFTNQTNVVVRAAPQPYGQRQPVVRRKV